MKRIRGFVNKDGQFNKKNKKTFGNNLGMTMVEVLMGFTILLLLLAMFSGIIATSSDIYYNSVDFRKADEVLQRNLYKTNITDGLIPESGVVSLVPAEGMPSEGTEIPMNAKLYKLDSSKLEGASAEDTLQVEVYFIR